MAPAWVYMRCSCAHVAGVNRARTCPERPAAWVWCLLHFSVVSFPNLYAAPQTGLCMATAKLNQSPPSRGGLAIWSLSQDDPRFAQIVQKLKTSERQSIKQSRAFQNGMANTTVVIEAAACVLRQKRRLEFWFCHRERIELKDGVHTLSPNAANQCPRAKGSDMEPPRYRGVHCIRLVRRWFQWRP